MIMSDIGKYEVMQRMLGYEPLGRSYDVNQIYGRVHTKKTTKSLLIELLGCFCVHVIGGR
ncbi:hypothetical protein J2T20_004017 [Paenibacillus wynnii]|nr:hypothetical protein [Paenibacillus wynnii]